MKRLKHNFKKGMAFVLSLAMVAGLVPAMSGGANKVQAASGSGTEPSVSAYATKEQLMTAFTPDSNGNATTIGKLVFGKNSSGNPQEWYILGKDGGVSGDENTIIFAASPIATGQVFNSSTSNKTYNYEAGTGYEESAGSIEVYPNHYGASDLRVALQRMLEDESGNAVETYFTTAEQGLMNDTTVTTKDMKNKDSSDNYLTYTTTDKLYALSVEGTDRTYNTIKAGSSDSTVLAMSSYWSNGSTFWLRLPYKTSIRAMLAIPRNYVFRGDVVKKGAVQPASNLNLSYVLFASAATATSSDTVKSDTIESGTAMTLRFDGTGKNIGTVTYNTTTGDIRAAKGSTSQTVALIVQGKVTVEGEEKDWYYSKKIGAAETVNASDIKSALNLSSDIDLSACKIWLETTDSTENLIYAVNATEDTSTSPDTMPIYVKTPDGNFIMLEIAKTATISAVKEEIFDKQNISVDEQQLLFNGEVLEDDKTLQDYSIGKDSILQLKVAAKPSVSAYATKEQLMTAFTPYSNGNATTIGKLVFGKKSDGTTAQEWYILGKDEGVSGDDNTIIFAASPIATGQAFEDDWQNNKNQPSLWSDCDYSGVSITEVYANHYGASDLREVLKGMATNTNYFTTAEQGLMNATTVTTKDTKNGVTYTTTDKLYALAADGAGSSYQTIKAGTSDSTVLAKSSYWSSGSLFWLRSPDDYNSGGALVVLPGDFVGSIGVNYVRAVQPASNLNLSSVLFASAATAASSDTAEPGTIADGKAMTLRFDGTGKNIGTVTYNNTTGDIKATKGSTSQTVALVVQGKDGTSDWYYSKRIAGPETVNASDITSALNLSSDIDLSACKIWLETTDSTENLTYAVGATEVLSITSVAITGIDTPVSNTALDTEASCVTTGVSSTTPQITWTPSDSTAGYNTSYTASIKLTAGTGYEFINSTTATVLENTATSVTKNADGTLTVTYAFPATAKGILTSITPPQAITVANGTAYDAMNLPATVNIVTEDNTVISAQVTWDTTTPASGSYAPAVLTQQTVTLNGEVTCPDSIDANGVSLTTTITITISAADIVKAPTANPTAGTYSENQSVALTSSTEGATIYYTTDGSEPTITGGTTKQYTAPIAVTGTEGQSVETTIKAIAVKNGMQDSRVEAFTYTIKIPVPKYTVTVTNGSGTGQYAQGETVTITAGAAPSGQQFKEWEVVSGTITLASSTSATTTFTMPAEAVSVKANYEAIPVTGYTITATAGANGSITPSGAVRVAAGGSQTFTISPSSGYVIDTLKVDSLEVTATTSYTFREVNANHTIEVTFKQESQTPDVTAPSITTQPGNATVKVGETATFTLAASGTALTYQWKNNRNDGNGWVNIAGANEASYTTSTVDISCNGFKYQCVVSNSAGTVTSNTAVLTVTENIIPDPDPVDYEILDGANSNWEQNSDGSLSIRGSGALSKFVGVKVDGTLVDAKNYTVKEGSTIVTLKADYLNTLSVGTHTFEILWTDGSASTTFTSKANTADNSNNNQNDNNNSDSSDDSNNNRNDNNNSDSSDDKPSSGTDKKDDVTKTGDNTPIVWLFILSILFGTGLIIAVKKRREKLNS